MLIPEAARLLPGDLGADCEWTPRSGFLGQIRAVRSVSNAEQD